MTVIKLLPEGSTLIRDSFVPVIPGMLVGTYHINKVVANGESDTNDTGRKVTFIFHLLSNSDTSSYHDHDSSMFLLGVP